MRTGLANLAWLIECCENYYEVCEKECRQMLGDRTMDACAKKCRQMAMKTSKARWPQGCFCHKDRRQMMYFFSAEVKVSYCVEYYLLQASIFQT